MPTAYPTLTVKVAFANNHGDSSLTWSDITQWARTVKTMRGRTRLLRSMAQFQAGTCGVQLDNRDRRFDPTNTAGPYYPNVTPEKIIQVGATWQGTYYPVWTGYVDDWPCVWPGFSDGRIDLTATDLFKSLGILRVLSSGYSQAILAQTPAAYWRLGEPAPIAGQAPPTIAADSSPNKVNAAYIGKLSLGATGALVSDPNTAADFSSGGYLNIPASLAAASSLNAGTHWAIQFWIKTTQNSATAYPIFQDQGIGGANGPLTIWLQNGMLGLTSTDAFGTKVDDGVWHQITLWATVLSTGGVEVYLAIDGNHWGYTTAGTYTTAPYFPGTATGAYIGGWAGFNGSIDEVSVYTGAHADAFQPTGNPLVWQQASKDFDLASFPAQYTGQRVDQVLDLIGFQSSWRRVDTGRTWCQREDTNQNNTKALLYLQRCEQTEQGQLFMAADGYAVFQDRYRRSLSSNVTPLAVVGDGGTANPLPPTDNYGNAVKASSPSDWLRLADAAGSKAVKDQETTAYDTAYGGVTFGVPGGPTGNTVASFDGNSGYISVVMTNTDLSQESTVARSVEIWYKTTWSGSYGTIAPLVYSQTASGTTAAQFELGINGSYLHVNWGGATLEDPATSNDGKWHYAVVTWDGTNMVLYRDGSQVASGTPTAGTTYWQASAILAAIAGSGITAQGFWPCELAEFALYNHALAASDVSRHYSQASTGQSQGSTEIPYEMGALTLNFDRQELYNEVPVTRRGGNQQVARDQSSITTYGDRTVIGGLTELLMDSDEQALYCAEWILADTAQPQLRIGDITLNPNTDDRLWKLVLSAEIGNIITVNKHNIPGGGSKISVNVRIEGIEHSIDPPYNWKVIWHLSKQDTQPWFLLDDAVSGLLDKGNRWGW